MKPSILLRQSIFKKLLTFMCLSSIAMLVAGVSFVAQPATYTRAAGLTCTGANGSWDDPATWTGCSGGVPGTGDDVIIADATAGGGAGVTITATHSVKSVTINAAGLLIFGAPVTLTVESSFSVDPAGLFDPGSTLAGTGGTVIFASGTQTITTNGVPVDFYNIEKTAAAPGDTLGFDAGAGGINALNRLNLMGTVANRLVLSSTTAGSQWNIGFAPLLLTLGIDYVNVQDSNNVVSATQVITVAHGADLGDNTGWVFPPLVTTTVALTSSGSPSIISQTVLFTATLTPVTATVGTVAFLDGAGDIVGCETQAIALVGGLPTATCATNSLAVGSHTITAQYSGDLATNFAASTSGPVTQVVKWSSSVALASDAARVISGTTVNLTATLGMPPVRLPPLPALTGNVTIQDGGVNIPACVNLPLTMAGVATVASCSLSTLAPGSHNLSAVYSGDTTYYSSTSHVLVETILIPTAVALTTSGSPSVFGNAVTFTATVPVAATGAVIFLDGATPIPNCTAVAVNGGLASCTTSALTVASHSITAQYNPDVSSTYGGNTSSVLTQQVNKALTTLALTTSGTPSAYGQVVTFTATVSPSAASGTVSFADGGVAVPNCSAKVVAAGVATCVTSVLTPTTHSLVATYSGDTNYQGSGSQTVSQVVNQAPTTVGLASSGTPSAYGQVVTFTATVSPSAATGTVAFKDGAVTLAGCGAQTLAGGVATCATSALAVGAHSLTAVYGGSTLYLTSTSTAIMQSVVASSSSVVLTTSGSPSAVGHAVTLTATISPSAATGTVAFKDGTNVITACSAQTVTAGVATCVTTSLSVGDHQLTAVYSGDANYATSTSAAVTQTVISFKVYLPLIVR